MRTEIITQPGNYDINVAKNEKVLVWLAQTADSTESLSCHINLTGIGAEATITGAFIQRKQERSQLDVVIHHQSPKTSAKFLVKGVLYDSAHARFTGLIKIDKGAQQTESFLEHRTLILSDEASVEPIPSLEIHADDVKASHAAAVSNLNDEDRFYLQSRGIQKEKVDTMLITSFLHDVTADMPPVAKKLVLAKL